MRGLVIRNTGSWYVVRTDDGQLVQCKIKGNFRLKGIRSTNPVAVGDYVQIAPNAEGTAFINCTEAEIKIRQVSLFKAVFHFIFIRITHFLSFLQAFFSLPCRNQNQSSVFC